MAVLAEAFSVVVPVDVINARLSGGLAAYRTMVPNRTYCTDGRLTRVGFFAPPDVRDFVENLQGVGLRLWGDGGFVDIAVIDQHSGPTDTCSWLRFEKHAEGFSTVRMSDEATLGHIAAPEGWSPTQSSSLKFIPSEEAGDRFFEFGEDSGDSVLPATSTGREANVVRASTTGDSRAAMSPLAFPLVVQHESFSVWWVNHVVAWPGLVQMLRPHADVHLPFLGDRWKEEQNGIELTLQGLILGILVSNEPPAHCPSPLTDAEAGLALLFAARAIGRDPDECSSSAARHLAEHFGVVVAIQALRRACSLLPSAVFSRGDLVVHLYGRAFERATDQRDDAILALRESGRVFLELPAGATARSTNEAAVLMGGLASLWFSDAKALAREALARHQARFDAHPELAHWLQELGINDA
jgi:hypothetical protein